MPRRSSYGFSFSWKRVLGITGVRQSFARKTGVPTTKQGLERKIGGTILGALLGLFQGSKKQ